MAPKKKGNKKKQQDDWEAELGETIAPASPAPAVEDGDPPTEEKKPAEQNDTVPAGGLMALMRKKDKKRKNKGMAEDWVDGETIPIAGTAVPEDEQPAFKAAEEADLGDEFAPPEKTKGAKVKQAQKQAQPADMDGADDGKVLTKAEKERLKKDKEKQRKKEQVGCRSPVVGREGHQPRANVCFLCALT